MDRASSNLIAQSAKPTLLQSHFVLQLSFVLDGDIMIPSFDTPHLLVRRLKLFFMIIFCSVCMGIASTFFLFSLDWAANQRQEYPFIVALLPAAGFATAFFYSRFGQSCGKGNNLVIESAVGDAQVPLRMGLMSFLFTVCTHLCGGSAGREGTAVQISGSITNQVGRWFNLTDKDRHLLILSGISAGFSSVFGTPLAGTFFGMEMCFVGSLSYEAFLPCVLAAFTSNQVALFLGASHATHSITQLPPINLGTALLLVFSACLFGWIGRLFVWCMHQVKRCYSYLPQKLLAGAAAGFVVLIALCIFGSEYGGLSTWMIDKSFAGKASWMDPLAKFIVTVLTLGGGFQGGEVTPLFTIGSSAGALIGQLFNLPPSLFAALGMVCVFGCAANTPVTTFMLGIELFGSEYAPYFLICAVISYLMCGHCGIYPSQRIVTPKSERWHNHIGLQLGEISSHSAVKPTDNPNDSLNLHQ